MSQRYTIELKNCAFFARHGLFEAEEFLGQRFFVDAELEVEAGAPLEDDSLEGTAHYGEVFQLIETIVTTTRRKLIEALANDIAKAVCGQFPSIRRARITVRKPSVPIPGILDYVQVSVEHRA